MYRTASPSKNWASSQLCSLGRGPNPKVNVVYVQGPLENVYSSALALGTANQLTNILRDVGEDVNERNRIYVPLEELDRFGISEAEVCYSALQQRVCIGRSPLLRTGFVNETGTSLKINFVSETKADEASCAKDILYQLVCVLS